MSVRIVKSTSYGRGANSVIFFFMVFWCLALGIVPTILMIKFLPDSMNGMKTAFPIIWSVFMGIATLVFLLIALAKVKGAGKARKIRKYGEVHTGYLTKYSRQDGIYSGTPVTTCKISFAYKMSNGEFAETTQLVSRYTYNTIRDRYEQEGVLPIRFLNDDAVLDTYKVDNHYEYTEEDKKVEETKPAVTSQKEELTADDQKYILELATAFLQENEAKKQELGINRFVELFKHHQTPKMNYIQGKRLLIKADTLAEVEEAMRYFALAIRDGLESYSLLETAILFDKGYKNYIKPDVATALRLYSTVFYTSNSFTASFAIVNMFKKDPECLKYLDDATFGLVYHNIAKSSLEKKNADGCYFLYKTTDKFFGKKNAEFNGMKKDHAYFIKHSFLSLAKEYGYKTDEIVEDVKNQNITLTADSLLEYCKKFENSMINHVKSLIKEGNKSTKDLGEIMAGLLVAQFIATTTTTQN